MRPVAGDHVRKVEAVTDEIEQTELAMVALHFLPVAVDQEEPGSIGAGSDGATLGHHRHRRVRIGIVVDQDVQELAVGLPPAIKQQDLIHHPTSVPA